MITALYSASADSIPILCITGQAPRARLHKEDFQAVDIEAIATEVMYKLFAMLEMKYDFKLSRDGETEEAK